MCWIKMVGMCLCLTLVPSCGYGKEFPYRAVFTDIPVVELEDLKKGYDNGECVIIDTRSAIEYETVHVKEALHIPLAETDFKANLKAVALQNPRKKIVVYGNGITSLKSYRAARVAIEDGMSNVFAYDGGILAWAQAFPGDTLLLGKRLADPGSSLIPERYFREKLVDFKLFKRLAADTDAQAIDVRDPMQRVGNLPGLENAYPVPLDKLYKNIIGHDRMKEKKLVIFDQAGCQVRWIMYHLEEKGYDYVFLKGGAMSVLQD